MDHTLVKRLAWRSLGGAAAERRAMNRLEGLAVWTESLRGTIVGAVGLEQAVPASLRVASPAIRGSLDRRRGAGRAAGGRRGRAERAGARRRHRRAGGPGAGHRPERGGPAEGHRHRRRGACAYAHDTVTAYEKTFNSSTSVQNVTVSVTVTLSVAPLIPAPGFTQVNVSSTQPATAVCGNADQQEQC